MIDPAVIKPWGIDLLHVRSDIPIPGSPERTDFRTVIEDVHQELYIIEAVKTKFAPAKIRIAHILEQLSLEGIPKVIPYCKTLDGTFLYSYIEQSWQVRPYIQGISLNRPSYVLDYWRGEAVATFLLALKNTHLIDDKPIFSLPAYINQLCKTIRQNRPGIYANIRPMFQYVQENLYPVYDRMPVCFSHGDYHALNIIWQEKSIAAVIDWEFCGIKPELYDAANMVSCLGIENPESLWTGAVLPFLHTLQSSGQYSDISIKNFIFLIIALRFAWLAEWLRKNDNEMIRMEFDYFDILSAQIRNLSAIWWK